MEDWKPIIFLIASGQGILLSIALITKFKGQCKANPFLGLIILIVSLELMSAWGMSADYFDSENPIPFWLIQSYLILPPSLWIFVRLNSNKAINVKKRLLLYIPAFLEIVCETVFYIYFRFTGNFINLLEFNFWYLFTEIIPIIWMVGMLATYGKMLYTNSDSMKTRAKLFLSSQKFKHRSFFVVFALITIFWAIGEFANLNLYTALNFMLVVFLFGLGYIGYSNPGFFQIPNQVSNFLYDDQIELTMMEKAFKEKALHTKPKLSLKELAAELNLPPRYISYLINTYHLTNFHAFVNTYRIKEVIVKLKDPSEFHKSILALAYESGFNSKSSFNKVFKEQTGHNPSDYLPQ